MPHPQPPLQFHITRIASVGYVLFDDVGDLHTSESFVSREAAADAAVRLAQAAGAISYAIYGQR